VLIAYGRALLAALLDAHDDPRIVISQQMQAGSWKVAAQLPIPSSDVPERCVSHARADAVRPRKPS
jgi:hypothetical protein